MFCRGASVMKPLLLPFVRTPISSQYESPLKTFPKSRVTVNSPLATATLLLVMRFPTAEPPELVG